MSKVINECMSCGWVGDAEDMIWETDNFGSEHSYCPKCESHNIEEK